VITLSHGKCPQGKGCTTETCSSASFNSGFKKSFHFNGNCETRQSHSYAMIRRKTF
ncbi:hypothetical protein BgiMline_000406, partial [Biomphalaria glabrata]